MKPDASTRSNVARQVVLIFAILLIGGVLAWLILGTGPSKPATRDNDPHQGAAGEDSTEGGDERRADAGPAKGRHGGKLFKEDGYGLEVTIFETGVEPQFRLYTYRDGKPLPPSESQANIVLHRLGREPQTIEFTPKQDYLLGNAVVEEPHSFTVKIAAQSGGKSYKFGYEQEETRITMSDAAVQQAGIRIATAGPANIRDTLKLIGEIHLNEDRTVHVVPRLTGVVESVPVSAGDTVRKGQVLAVISSQSLADQRSEYLAAQKRLTLAQTTFEREKRLWEEKISAEQDFLQARNAMQEARIVLETARQKLTALGSGTSPSGNLTRYEIKAPIDGVITARDIAIGEAIREDKDIFTLADLSTVWAEMVVYAKDLQTVKIGQAATVNAVAFDSRSEGKIFYIGALVGEQTRSAVARIVLPNPDGVWRPGLPVNIELVTGDAKAPVAVAADAIQTLRDWQVVFGRYGNQFEARPLELGRSDGKFVEVLAGLQAGEQYAASNSFVIKADIGKSGASHDH